MKELRDVYSLFHGIDEDFAAILETIKTAGFAGTVSMDGGDKIRQGMALAIEWTAFIKGQVEAQTLPQIGTTSESVPAKAKNTRKDSGKRRGLSDEGEGDKSKKTP